MIAKSDPNEIKIWKKVFNKNKIIAIDIEFVSLRNPASDGEKFRAATVSVVDSSGNSIYEKTVRFNKDEYVVNDYVRQITEFNETQFVSNGTDFEVIRKEVKKLMEENLVMCRVTNDFSALNLYSLQFEINLFIIQDYWRVRDIDGQVKPCSLGQIY